MHTQTNKELAKEILLKCLEKDCILRSEYPETETAVDAVCTAYKKILKTIEEND
ncbi:hypothetical protein [Desulfitobacterium hafniense]|uniref:hypothetical protein n=1 Tax=Desulfitobacterium hafniense TaxID=49338 RepID=UPI000311A42D|nr:hypothetical protein [Desulfitobacterium hafniense]